MLVVSTYDSPPAKSYVINVGQLMCEQYIRTDVVRGADCCCYVYRVHLACTAVLGNLARKFECEPWTVMPTLPLKMTGRSRTCMKIDFLKPLYCPCLLTKVMGFAHGVTVVLYSSRLTHRALCS